MAFEIDYKTLRGPGFRAAMRKLCNHDGFGDVKTAYNVSRIGSLLEQEMKTADKLFIDIAKKYVMPGAKDGTLKQTDGKWEFKSKELEAEFEEKFHEFHDHVVTIERHQVKLSALSKLNLSPNDILALEPVLEDDMEEVGVIKHMKVPLKDA